MIPIRQTIRAAALLLVPAGVAAQAVAIVVPSGQALTLAEVLADENPGELWLRFRFVAPGIASDGGDIDHDTASADLDWLCANLALPYIDSRGLKPALVIVSMSDRPVRFGVTDPQATQYFETYRPESGRCIWEGF